MASNPSEITLRPFRISDAEELLKYAGDEYRCRAQLAYGTAREYWGQGITARAAKMAISEGLREFPDLVRLRSFVEVENKASQRVLEKIGFQKEGVMRKYGFNRGQIKDMVLFSLLSTDPIP